jgi:hypothetical protein
MKDDTDQRYCRVCNGEFSPYSMQPDYKPRVPAPANYVCLTCRTLGGRK